MTTPQVKNQATMFLFTYSPSAATKKLKNKAVAAKRVLRTRTTFKVCCWRWYSLAVSVCPPSATRYNGLTLVDSRSPSKSRWSRLLLRLTSVSNVTVWISLFYFFPEIAHINTNQTVPKSIIWRLCIESISSAAIRRLQREISWCPSPSSTQRTDITFGAFIYRAHILCS